MNEYESFSHVSLCLGGWVNNVQLYALSLAIYVTAL